MRVMLATDGSEGARSAAEALKVFPLPAASEGLVVSAAPNLAVAANLRSTVELQRWLDALAERAVADAQRIVGDRFERIDTRVVVGEPRAAVLAAARDWNAELIVLGARGLGRIGSFLLGSVSTAVTRHAHCPVLIAKAGPRPIRQVVVGIDSSEHALAATRFVASLPLGGATLNLVAVLEPLRYPTAAPEFLDGALGSNLAAATDELRRHLGAALEHAKRELAGCGAHVTTRLVEGSPADELVHACSDGADLLVVGARGVGGFERALLGSVSESALRSAPCSVLVVAHR
jgi:nucleotide-binding universal stress UspA family protein